MDLKERRSINHRRKERFTVVFTWWFHVVIQQTTSKNSTEMRHSSNQIIVFWRYLCRCCRLYLSLFISLARRKTYWQKSTFAFPKTWNDELLIKTGKFHKTKLLFLSYNFLCSCSCLVKKGKRKNNIEILHISGEVYEGKIFSDTFVGDSMFRVHYNPFIAM